MAVKGFQSYASRHFKLRQQVEIVPMIPENENQFRPPVPRYPTVSFVIPAHNESDYLGKTLTSLHRSAQALELNYEVIVVDDASTDDTAEIAIANGARATKVDLRNIGAVRNAGAREAVYTCLIFLDADTLLPEKTLRQSMDAMCNGIAGGGAHVLIDRIDEVSWDKKMMYYAVRIVWQVIGGWAAGCFMFCRRDLFEHFGGFDEEYFAAEELFFSRNVKQHGRFKIVRNPVITSSRKFHSYSTKELFRFVFLPILSPQGRFRSKVGLEVLYDHHR
jgi:glycosyltransferase involved in cell wall biosynthesis